MFIHYVLTGALFWNGSSMKSLAGEIRIFLLFFQTLKMNVICMTYLSGQNEAGCQVFLFIVLQVF